MSGTCGLAKCGQSKSRNFSISKKFMTSISVARFAARILAVSQFIAGAGTIGTHIGTHIST